VKQADVAEWAAALAHHFAVACPELKHDEVWREPAKDVTVDVSRDQRRFFGGDYIPDIAYNFPGYRVIVHLPFEGDADVFKLCPSTRTTVWPRGRIVKDELLVHDRLAARQPAGHRRRRPGGDQRRRPLHRLVARADRNLQWRARAPGTGGDRGSAPAARTARRQPGQVEHSRPPPR